MDIKTVFIDESILTEVDFKYYLKQICFGDKLHVILYKKMLDDLHKACDYLSYGYQKENVKQLSGFIYDLVDDFEKVSNGGISLDSVVDSKGCLLSIWNDTGDKKLQNSLNTTNLFLNFVKSRSAKLEKENIIIFSKDGYVLLEFKKKGFNTQKFDVEKIHHGFSEVNHSQMESLKKGNQVKGIYLNDFVKEGNQISKIIKSGVEKINFKFPSMAIDPEDLYQKMYCNHLLTPMTSVVLCTGKAGSGKTLMAIQTGIIQIAEKKYERLVIARAAVSSEDIGHLPGNAKEKTMQYMYSLRDNIVKLSNKKWKHADLAKKMLLDLDAISGEEKEGLLEVQPLVSLQGRTLDNAFIIIDEAQNLTRSQAKSFITRVGKAKESDSKLVLCGDISQISNAKIGPYTNGLAVSLRTLKRELIVGISHLTKCYRSNTAALGDYFE